MSSTPSRSSTSVPTEADPRTVSRFNASKFRDTRWIVGVLLLLAGFAGTLKAVSALDNSVTVWTAKRQLMPGQKLTTDDVVAKKVRLDAAQSRYLSASQPANGVVQRPIEAGELLPAAAVGSGDSVHVREVAVKIDSGNADVVRAGSLVELWVAKKRDGAGAASYEAPTKISSQAVISHVGSRNGGVVSVADGQSVQVLVPTDQVAEVIDAVNSEAKITLVPVVSGALK